MEQAYSTQHHPSYSFNDGPTAPPSSRGHSHSLSLGQMPSSSSASSSSYAYDHHHNQYGAQHQQQQHNINTNTSNHSRSFSANDTLSSSSDHHLLHSPYLSAAAAGAQHGTSSSNGGDSNPTSRTQTISPLMAHPSLPGSSSSNLGQSLHYSQGLGLAGIPTSPDPSSHAGGIYAPMPSYMQQHLPPHQQHAQQSMQYHMHGAITPPSPSTGHASSIRHSHSLSDGSLSYTPQSYASTASSLPSSYHPGLSGTSNNKYDPHSLPDILAHHHHSHPHHAAATSSSSYPPYPLSTSAQGFMTIYTTSPTYGSKDSQINLEVGVAPHDPHYIRGFRVLFGSHGTTTRVVGESRSEGEERVELVAVVPPIQLTNRIPPNGTTCQLSLQALDESGKVADWADLGVFEFTGESWLLLSSLLLEWCISDTYICPYLLINDIRRQTSCHRLEDIKEPAHHYQVSEIRPTLRCDPSSQINHLIRMRPTSHHPTKEVIQEDHLSVLWSMASTTCLILETQAWRVI